MSYYNEHGELLTRIPVTAEDCARFKGGLVSIKRDGIVIGFQWSDGSPLLPNMVYTADKKGNLALIERIDYSPNS